MAEDLTRALQAQGLDILLQIDKMCQKYSIRY